MSGTHATPAGGPGRLLVAGLLLTLGACALPPDVPTDGAPLAGRIYDNEARRFVGEDAALDALAEADFVLLGERHDNPEHHRLQARIVGELQAAWPEPAPVAFEMMGTDQQLAIVEQVDAAPGDATGLGAALDWDSSGWPAFAMYAPILQATLDAGGEIVAANLPEHDTRDVFARGADALSPALLERTGLETPLPAALAVDLRTELEQSHCGRVPPEMVNGMYRVQRARDAIMADRLATLAGNGRGILIAGAGHVRTDRGVPWYLERLRPDATIASVAFVEARPGERVRGDLPFDLLWFTGSVVRGDPCAGLAERFERAGEGAD